MKREAVKDLKDLGAVREQLRRAEAAAAAERERLAAEADRKSTRLNSSHSQQSRMPSSA